MFQASNSSFCRQIPPSPRKSRSFPVAIISRFAAYNVQSEGALKIAGSRKYGRKGGTGESGQGIVAAVEVDRTSVATTVG